MEINNDLAEVSTRMIGGAIVTPLEMFNLLRLLRHINAEAETLGQVFQNLTKQK